jgi:hypothetical protein
MYSFRNTPMIVPFISQGVDVYRQKLRDGSKLLRTSKGVTGVVRVDGAVRVDAVWSGWMVHYA